MSLKLRGLTTKYILKRALAGILPREILARPKKGFGIPLGQWFRGTLRPLVREAPRSRRDPPGRCSSARDCRATSPSTTSGRRDHRKKLYTLLAFQLWASRYRPA